MSKASARASTATSSISPSTPTAKARSTSSLKRSRVVKKLSRVLMGGFLAEGGSAPVQSLMRCIRACLGGRMLVKRFDLICVWRTGVDGQVGL